MSKKCFVPVCNNDNSMNKLFFTVPFDEDRRSKWFRTVGITKLTKSHRLYCCEDHFILEEDTENWTFFKTIGTQLILRKNVVPHLYLESPKKDSMTSQLSVSAKKRKYEVVEKLKGPQLAKRVLFPLESEPSMSSSILEPTSPSSSVSKSSDAPLPLLTMSPSQRMSSEAVVSPSGKFYVRVLYETKTTQTVQHTKNKGVNTTMTMKTVSTSPLQKDSGNLFQITKPRKIIMAHLLGLSTRMTPEETFSSSSSSMDHPTTGSEYSPSKSNGSEYKESAHNRLKSTVFLIETKSRFYLGVPQEVYFLVKFVATYTDVHYRDVLICIKKIRQNDQYSRIADDFEMSTSNVQRIFSSHVPKISSALKHLIFWPEPAKIRKVLPIPFRARFSKVESIIDCLEIQIEKPSNPLKQALSWSEYKKANTIKYLISSTPSGFVNYISPGYSGRITDREVVIESGYLNALPRDTAVLADRGFKHVAPLLLTKKCQLIRPPSVEEGTSMSKEEVKKTRTIASLRIHIERVIRGIREFEMLAPHATINMHLLYLMDCIITIACAIVNTQGPLIK